ncbi:MAG: YicC/YloC family endoribonuclease [bacterium]|nr:YicC/YloC family endoribonuclease [bacterium]
MLKSMTGYGRSSNEYLIVEIQAINHKYCEIKVSLPPFMTYLENKIKEYVMTRVARGKLYIPIILKNTNTSVNKFQLDKELARTYLDSFRELSKSLRLKDDLKLSHLIGIEGIVSNGRVSEQRNKSWEGLQKPLAQALEELIATRAVEGEKIESEFKTRLKSMLELVTEIEQRAPQVVLDYKEKLQNRLETLQINKGVSDKTCFDETRLYQEIALFADKCDITEELLRLKSHLQQFSDTIILDKPVGRQLEFLAQELHREINTIGSKTGDLKIIQLVLNAKNELEKIREQIQNVE